jgi:predicted DNA-binding transcriptional regulator AlpA
MPAAIVTIEDLELFKKQLIAEIKNLLHDRRLPDSADPREGESYLKQKEVCSMLRLSPSTLQRLRIAGKLRSVKLGGQHYYKLSEIEKMMSDENKGRVQRLL